MQTKVSTTVMNLSDIEDSITSLNKTLDYLMDNLSENSAASYVLNWYSLVYSISLDSISSFLSYLAVEATHNKLLLYKAVTDFESIEDYLKNHSNSYDLVEVEVTSESDISGYIPYQAKIVALRTLNGDWITML